MIKEENGENASHGIEEKKEEVLKQSKEVRSDADSFFEDTEIASYRLYKGDGGHRTVRQVIIIEKQPTLGDVLQRIAVISVYALIIQTFFTAWKKINKKTHDVCVFLILLLFPPGFFLFMQSYFLPFCWLLFSGFMLFNTLKVMKGPLGKNVMRDIYGVFRSLFIISNLGTLLGQSLTFVFFYLKPEYLGYTLSILLFFLYFGLLSREVIFFLSETMAVSTGFYSKEGVPGKGNNNSLCMICTKLFDGSEKIHTLVCAHSFHEDCIKGWCLLGKKPFCPYCKKKIESASLPPELWHKAEVWFYPLINTLRSFIVLTLVLTGIILYKIRYQ
ncbi:RING finger-like domain-containing protein [Encephalitozoon hellem]|nr:RING finger-like domain-containing protein [Encephalitozoon hellem]